MVSDIGHRSIIRIKPARKLANAKAWAEAGRKNVNYREESPKGPIRFSPHRVFYGVLAVVALILMFWAAGNIFEHLNADQIMCIQSPVRGKLTWHKDAGVKIQWFGRVTKYKKRSQFWFSARTDQGVKEDESILVRFNDGGHAKISGSIAWEMPLDVTHLNEIQTKYGDQHAVEQQLIRTVVEKAVYMTGPLMSSKESYAERRNELLQYIEDQVQNGVFRTETKQEKVPDPMTGQLKTVNVVSLIKDERGAYVRSFVSPLGLFGIRTYIPSINEVKYDPTVEDQIKQQQRAIMDVQTAQANAKKAEQDAITAEKNGQAGAAVAKWLQEVVKAKAVTEAQQQLEVATLNAKAAEMTKKKLVLEGEGEATKRQLIMSADGALDKKLAVYQEVQRTWAEAVKGYTGAWVPSVVMSPSGSSSGTAGSGMIQLLEIMAAKSARDLGLDIAAGGTERTKAKQK